MREDLLEGEDLLEREYLLGTEDILMREDLLEREDLLKREDSLQREDILMREDLLERVMRETYTARNVQVTASLHSSSLYIRIRSHRLLRLDDNKFAASCQQT